MIMVEFGVVWNMGQVKTGKRIVEVSRDWLGIEKWYMFG